MREGSFFSELYNGIRDAVADIREKVVEEPWWGRSVGEGQSQESTAPQWSQAQQAGSHAQSIEREPERNVADYDIER